MPEPDFDPSDAGYWSILVPSASWIVWIGLPSAATTSVWVVVPGLNSLTLSALIRLGESPQPLSDSKAVSDRAVRAAACLNIVSHSHRGPKTAGVLRESDERRNRTPHIAIDSAATLA